MFKADDEVINQNKKKFTVLFLTKWYPNKYDPQLGVFVRKHAKAVSEFCNVILIYNQQDEQLENTYIVESSNQNGFEEVIIYYKKSKSIFSALINSYRYFQSFRIALKKSNLTLKKIDLIHTNVLNRPGMIALFLFFFRNKSYIVTEHWTGYTSGKFSKNSFLKRWLTKTIIKNSKAVTVVSQSLRNSMLDLKLNGNYFVIPNVIESINFNKIENKAERNTNKKIKILTVSDLVDSQKNISGIIKAINKLSQTYKNIEYHIIGDGPDKLLLHQLADNLGMMNNTVFFQGRKTNEFVYSFIPSIDFVVINSNYETFSVVAAESLVFGKPVITTICGGPEEFITDEFGILIKKNNQTELENALLKMISTYQNYDSKKLHDYISAKFNYRAIGKQFFDIYNQVANK